GSARRTLRHHVVQEMPAGTVLDLDDPGVGVEADLARKPLLDLLLRHRRVAEAAHERAVAWVRLLEHRLRRGTEQLGGAVEPVKLDEARARPRGAAPAHRREGALAVAAAHIGGDPDRGFETHRFALPKFESQVTRDVSRTSEAGHQATLPPATTDIDSVR